MQSLFSFFQDAIFSVLCQRLQSFIRVWQHHGGSGGVRPGKGFVTTFFHTQLNIFFFTVSVLIKKEAFLSLQEQGLTRNMQKGE
jgi:hypothetical protein